jgi:hypothetical protein
MTLMEAFYLKSDVIRVQVTNCETQKAIAKAGIVDCGIVTIQIYHGLIRGLFGKEMEVSVKHTKNLNKGDDCCEVVICTQTHHGANSRYGSDE